MPYIKLPTTLAFDSFLIYSCSFSTDNLKCCVNRELTGLEFIMPNQEISLRTSFRYILCEKNNLITFLSQNLNRQSRSFISNTKLSLFSTHQCVTFPYTSYMHVIYIYTTSKSYTTL